MTIEFKTLVKHKIIDDLKQEFLEAKKLILQSIKEERMIIIRHDSDADGYAAGICLENAIIPLIVRERTPRLMWKHFRRIVNRTPFLDYTDASKDAQIIMEQERLGKKKPLFIYMDFGLGMENETAMKKIKFLGGKILVVDHHVISNQVKDIPHVIVNPHLKGHNSDFCTGMLGAELSNLLVKNEDLRLHAAIAGIADKTSEELIRQYYPVTEELKQLTEVINFETLFNRFFDGYTTVEMLFENGEKAKGLVKILLPKIQELKQEQLEILKRHCEKHNDLVLVDLDKYCSRNYPPAGKSVGLLFREFENKKITVIGYSSSFLILRSNNLDTHILIKHLKKKFPQAKISGGGHMFAGGISFLTGYKEDVLKELKNFIK